MEIRVDIKGIKVLVTCTVEDMVTLVAALQVAEEMTEEPTQLDGYDVEQYNKEDDLVEIYKGFKIYNSITGRYYRFFNGKKYSDKSELFDTLDKAKLMIDDIIIRMNRRT